MIECPACGRQYRSGTLFCSDCGAYLPTGSWLRTDPLPEDKVPAPLADPQSISFSKDQIAAKPTAVQITILESGRQVQLPTVSEIFLGRLDAAHGFFPDLDLTPDGGIESGVSRRHARILCQNNCFFIEDIGSINGTLLNGRCITPYLPHPLRTGDELKIGRITMVVELIFDVEGDEN